MPILAVILIAIGLSMDAFAVSVACGFAARRLHILHAVRTALFFGVFQAIMPITGWLAGLTLRRFISTFDHWVAFGLLAFIGGKMIYEALILEKDERTAGPQSLNTLLLLSVATSIDALAVGLSLSFLNVAIVVPAAIIGVITFGLSLLGGYIGARFGHFFERGIEVAGGVILIAIGAGILLRHILAPTG